MFCIRSEQVDRAAVGTFAVTTFPQVKWDSEDQIRLLMNQTRFPRTGALNDSNLVRISLLSSWNSVDIGKQKFVILAVVIIAPGGLQSFGECVS